MEQFTVPTSLDDHKSARAFAGWDSAASGLDGPPGGRGVNIRSGLVTDLTYAQFQGQTARFRHRLPELRHVLVVGGDPPPGTLDGYLWFVAHTNDVVKPASSVRPVRSVSHA